MNILGERMIGCRGANNPSYFAELKCRSLVLQIASDVCDDPLRCKSSKAISLPAKANISMAQVAIVRDRARTRGYHGPVAQLKRRGDKTIYYAGKQGFSRPGSYCFDEFLIDHLKYTFGKQWGRSEARLPRDKQHAVIQWMCDLFDHQREAIPPDHDPRIVVSLLPTGPILSIISLADDLYRLRLVDRLPDTIIKRLRKRASFQGARYEVALAASFVRSGFQIDWLENEEETHGEFSATLASTSDRLVIEAKSRRRSGVLHEVGSQEEFEHVTVGVTKLYERALNKETQGLPLMICIDVNLPLAINDMDTSKKWFPAIQEAFKKFPPPSELKPSKEFCLAFTNFGWYYCGTETAPAHQAFYVFPNYVQAVPDKLETFAALVQALDNYGQRPEVLHGY